MSIVDELKRARSEAELRAFLKNFEASLRPSLKSSTAMSASAAIKTGDVCDSVLRECLHHLADGSHSEKNLALISCVAEQAFKGFKVLSKKKDMPLYLEKILLNLLKKLRDCGLHSSLVLFSDHIFSSLMRWREVCVQDSALLKDYDLIARYSYDFLARVATQIAPQDPSKAEPSQCQEVLLMRLRAVKFLVLIEGLGRKNAGSGEPPSAFCSQSMNAALRYKRDRAKLTALDLRFLSDKYYSPLMSLLTDVFAQDTEQYKRLLFDLLLQQCKLLCVSSITVSEDVSVASEIMSMLKQHVISSGPSGQDTWCLPAKLCSLALDMWKSFLMPDFRFVTSDVFGQLARQLQGVASTAEAFSEIVDSCGVVMTTLESVICTKEGNEFGKLFDWSGIFHFHDLMEAFVKVIEVQNKRRLKQDGVQQEKLQQKVHSTLMLFITLVEKQLPHLVSIEVDAAGDGVERLVNLLEATLEKIEMNLSVLEALGQDTSSTTGAAVGAYQLSRTFLKQDLSSETVTLATAAYRLMERALNLSTQPNTLTGKFVAFATLLVEVYRRAGRFGDAMAAVARSCWLLMGDLHACLPALVSLWVQVKADAVGAGQATIKLRTLREALSDYEVGTDELLVVLDEELRQYKAQHVDATQERYNVICDLLELCPEEEIDRCLDRSLHLIRLAEFLCYNDTIGQAECSALDCAQEAVRLLDSINVEWWPSSERERYTDIKATANLWLFICTLEATAKKATEREERLARVADPVLEVSINDLDVEDKQSEDSRLHCHMLFNIASDKQACTPLDRALELWQNLLGGSTLPALNNSQQTLLHIRMMTELYRLIDKPLQALKSCLLQQQLSGWLEDWPGNIMAGCLAARLLLNLDCPQHAQVFVDEVESRMESISKPDDKLSVLEKNVKLTKSQFHYAMGQVEMGFLLLLEILEDPNIWRPSRTWYLLRSRTYALASLYTNLPGNQLAQSERERLPQLDLRSPLVAVSVAHRLLTGFMQAILGPSFNNTQGSDKPTSTATTSIFIDQGDNVLLKWTVLTELLDVSRHLVSLQAKRGIVVEAKSFCIEALKLTTKLQLTRRCAELLIVKASLEVQRGELEESKHELKQLSFLLESSQEFEATKKAGADFKLKKLSGTAKSASKRSPVAEEEQEKESENQSFLKSIPLSLVHGREQSITGADGISSSPGLAKQKSRLPQVHKAQCACTNCRDVVLSLITAEWFLTQSCMEDALQNDTVSRRFLLAALQQAAALKQRGAAMLHEILARRPGGWPLLLKNAAFQMTHAVEATVRLELALRALKVGSFVGVADNVQKGLQVFQSTELGLADAHDIKANLLIVKAIMMLLQLSLKQDCSVAELFQSSWALNTMITPCEEEPDLPSVNNTETSTSTNVASTGIVKPPPSAQKKKREFPQTPNFGFKTPARSTASRSAIKPSQGFFILEDSNSSNSPIPPCVKAQKKVQTRLRIVTFSDSDEDSELPRHQQVAASDRGSSSAKVKEPFSMIVSKPKVPTKVPTCKVKPAKDEKPTARAQPTKAASSAHGGSATLVKLEKVGRGQTTQSQPKKQLKSVETTAKAKGSRWMASAVQQDKPMDDAEAKVLRKTKQAGRATIGRGHDVEREDLRQGDTDDVWLDLDQSIEVIRALDEDSPLDDKRVMRKVKSKIAESKVAKVSRARKTQDREMEVVRRQIPTEPDEYTAPERLVQAPAPLHVTRLNTNDGSLSLEAARDVLLAALECISHNPSGASYRVLAQLLALHAGDGLRLGDGHSEKGAGLETAWLHNEGLSVTLRHQMIANVTRKIRKGEGEAVQCTPGSRDGHLQQILPLFNFQPQFAAGMHQRAQEFAEAFDLIPDGVAVCTLSIVNLFPWDLRKIRDVGELVLLTRLERGARPITVRLHPGKDQVGLDWVLAEFDSILKQQAVVSNMTEKKLWWQHRNELDERMQRLLTALEEQVIGCWKGLLLPPVMRSSQLAEVLHEEAEALKQLLSDKSPPVSYELLQVVLSGADSLSKKKLRSLADALCPHEDFLPSLQEAVARIRSTRVAAAAAATTSTTQHPGSTVLILDKNLQKLPWENIPLLRASSVTRMPSLAFVLASALTTKYVKSNVFNTKVDVRNTFYLLNPQANLSSTESTFRDWFESEKDWEGVIGKIPTAEKLQEVLTKKDLYIYAGHGAGAQILKPHAIPRLDCRAVSLLFGCSSGALAMRGTLEASGIALNYIMAGCPCILGNLWDVTDRDIDRYMEALLRTWLSAPPGASISEHMVHARQAPRLKFLIGAAPILYGLPVLRR